MKHAKTIGDIGSILMVLGSILYLVDILSAVIIPGVQIILCCVYGAALVLMLIGHIGTREERKARKAEKKAARA